MPDETTDQLKIRKTFCSNCGGDRNCEIRGHHTQSGSESDHYYWTTDWFILECRGCEHVFALTVSTNSEDVDYDYGPDGEIVSFYPETLDFWPSRSKRDRPIWLSEIALDDVDTSPLEQSLSELYGALDNDLFSLAGIGVRTTFDIASELLGVDTSLTFAKKLDALVDGGHIGKADRSHVETLIDAGSASAHRGWRPTAGDLKTMMDVLEYFILSAFVEPERRKRRSEEVSRLKPPPKPSRKAPEPKAPEPKAPEFQLGPKPV